MTLYEEILEETRQIVDEAKKNTPPSRSSEWNIYYGLLKMAGLALQIWARAISRKGVS